MHVALVLSDHVDGVRGPWFESRDGELEGVLVHRPLFFVHDYPQGSACEARWRKTPGDGDAACGDALHRHVLRREVCGSG